MWLIKNRRITFLISGALVLLSILAAGFWGLKPGIDFTGGSLLEIEYRGPRPDLAELQKRADATGFPRAVIQPTGERGIFVRAEHLTEERHQALVSGLAAGESGSVTEKRFDAIGPTIGRELARKSFWAVALVIILIVSYIGWAFRKVSEPVASWKYGVATVIALVHDVAIPVGIFSALGHFGGVEVDTLFVTALLTILGFSVHDTIVVFDRIRENLKIAKGKLPFDAVVGNSISQTLTRSINTSLTVLLVLLAIYFFGGASVEYFALALITGIFFGTYSSICLASPLLVTWHEWSERRGE